MLIDPIAHHAATRPDALAAIDLASGRRWTWAALDADVARVAAWLGNRVGTGSTGAGGAGATGARVATLCRNSVDMLVLQHACGRAGAIFVPLNWRLAPAEIAVLIADAAPALLFCDAEFAGPYAGPEQRPTADIATLCAPAPPPELPARDADAPYTILYTSGTSGTPKGVVISAANAYWGASNFIGGNDVGDGSVFLCDMPFFHTAGLFAAAGVAIVAGGVVCISPGFDPVRTLARIADPQLGITHYFSVPQMAQMLWNQPDFQPEMLARLRVYATGGAPNP
ncbi:MAG: AMP-binding protein, partial [Sphingopyxis sp.]